MVHSGASEYNAGTAALSIGVRLFLANADLLLGLRRGLPSDVTPEDFRVALLEMAGLLEVTLRSSAGADGRPDEGTVVKVRELLDLPMGLPIPGREDLTSREFILWLDEKAGWSEVALRFLDEVMSGSQPSVVPDLLAGHSWVVPVPIGDGYKLPVMLTVATPFTPRKEWLDRVSFQFQSQFKPMAQMKPESLREAARALPGWLEDTESRDIADELFEEEGYRDRLREEHPDKSAAERESFERLRLEERLANLGAVQAGKTARAEELMRTASTARIRFFGAGVEQQREVLSTVLLNAKVQDQEIVEYQLKSPFNLLQMDSNGALLTEKWGLLDLNNYPADF